MTSSHLTRNQKIVVIGAGIAGLTAAYRLHKREIDVTVCEARGRVGGRILTAQIDDQIGELGALSLSDGGKAPHMHQLIEELGLQVISDTATSRQAYFTGEKLIPGHEFTSFLNLHTLKEQLAAITQKAKSMHEVLSILFRGNDPAFKCFATRLACYEGAAVNQLSSLYTTTLYNMIVKSISSSLKEMQTTFVTIQGGNSHLPKKLAESLGAKIHLHTPLQSVVKTKDHSYTLFFQGGKTLQADVLLLAIPSPIYTDIHFGEGVIPKERLSAIRTIQNGTNAKILIPFTKGAQERIFLINDRMGAFFRGNPHLLTCYYTGVSSQFSEDSIADTLREDQTMLTLGCSYVPSKPPVIARDKPFACYEGPVGYSWPNDPYAKGSYSYIAPGQETLLTKTHTVDNEVVKTLFAPVDRTLYFAGEHTSILHEIPGTMEAACESGERAARMITQGLTNG